MGCQNGPNSLKNRCKRKIRIYVSGVAEKVLGGILGSIPKVSFTGRSRGDCWDDSGGSQGGIPDLRAARECSRSGQVCPEEWLGPPRGDRGSKRMPRGARRCPKGTTIDEQVARKSEEMEDLSSDRRGPC